MLGPTPRIPSPRKDPDSVDEMGADTVRTSVSSDAGEPSPVDLSVEVTDAEGVSARVTLSDYGAIRRPLETYVLRRRDIESQRFSEHWELVLQTFSIPLGDFVAQAPHLDLRRITSLAFVFDKAHAGEVSIDQIGFSDLDPAFLSARVENSEK